MKERNHSDKLWNTRFGGSESESESEYGYNKKTKTDNIKKKYTSYDPQKDKQNVAFYKKNVKVVQT